LKSNKIIKVVLAAGLSKRYGLKNKILEKINGKTVIETILDRLIQIDSNKNNIVVIGGNNYNSLKKTLNKYDVKLFYNKNYKNGLGSSVSFIFKKKINKNGIMFIPGDMPLISIKDFKKLINTFVQKKNKIISPCYKKKIGNPLIIPKIYFNLLKNLKKDEGARKFLPSKDFIHVPCGYGTIFDIDTKYELLKAKLLNKKLNY
tara:strand:- start:162 stop:770 length:609 start_codon:yes stop_codon:yes gene_type:complete